MRRISGLVTAAVMCASQPLPAQVLWEPGPPGDDFGSVVVYGGNLSPATTFSDDGSSFEDGVAFGVSLSYWPLAHVGVRTHVLRAKTAGNHGDLAPCPPTPCSAIGWQEPVVWLYGIEAMVRRPMGGPQLAWFPYLGAGVVGKSYRWSVYPPRVGDSAGGWTVAGGIEVRPSATGPLGLLVEVRNYQTDFRFFDKRAQSHSDFAFTAGMSVNR